MREAIPPPLKRSPSLYTSEAYFIRNNPQRNAVQNKRRCRLAPSFPISPQDREPSPVFFYFNNTLKMPYKKNIEISIM